jgi:hypothetical protein
MAIWRMRSGLMPRPMRSSRWLRQDREEVGLENAPIYISVGKMENRAGKSFQPLAAKSKGCP